MFRLLLELMMQARRRKVVQPGQLGYSGAYSFSWQEAYAGKELIQQENPLKPRASKGFQCEEKDLNLHDLAVTGT